MTFNVILRWLPMLEWVGIYHVKSVNPARRPPTLFFGTYPTCVIITTAGRILTIVHRSATKARANKAHSLPSLCHCTSTKYTEIAVDCIITRSAITFYVDDDSLPCALSYTMIEAGGHSIVDRYCNQWVCITAQTPQAVEPWQAFRQVLVLADLQ